MHDACTLSFFSCFYVDFKTLKHPRKLYMKCTTPNYIFLSSMDHGKHFGELGSVVHLSKVRSNGILVFSVRLSYIAIHSQYMYKND